MAVAFHTHTFDIPTATDAEVAAGTRSDVAVVPSNLGTASQSDVGDFATAAQGTLADTAVQPAREVNAGTGLTGGGDLSADRTIALDGASIASLDLADGAAQKDQNLADLADKGTAQDNIQVGVTFSSVSLAQAATVPARNKRIRTQFYSPNYATPATLVGGANYRRISFSSLSSYPASAYFRSADRFMPDGTTDSTNGGYWVIDEDRPNVFMLGALGDGATDDTTPLADGVTLSTQINRPVYLLGGTYMCSTLVLAASSALIGADRDRVTIKRLSATLGVDGRGLVKVNGSNARAEEFTINLNAPLMGNWISGLSPIVSCDNVTLRRLSIRDASFNGLDWNSQSGVLSFNNIVLDDIYIENSGWIGAKIESIAGGMARVRVYKAGFNAIEVENCSAGFVIYPEADKSLRPTKQYNGVGRTGVVTSTSSVAIGTGNKTFTVSAGAAIVYEQACYIRSDSDPDNVWMWGKVSSYSGTTLIINVSATSGAGTHTDWRIDTERGMLLFRGIYNNGVTYEHPRLIDNRNAREDGLGIGEVGEASSSSVSIGTGSKSFTITAGVDYRVGRTVSVFSKASPLTRVMRGAVTSYSGTTLTLNITEATGSGTYTDWQLNVESGVEIINQPYVYRAGLFGIDLQSNNTLNGGVIEEVWERGLELGYDLGGWMRNVQVGGGLLIRNTGNATQAAISDATGVFVGNSSYQVFQNIKFADIIVVDDRPTKYTEYGLTANDANTVFSNFVVDDTNNFTAVNTSPIFLFGANPDLVIQNQPIVYTPTPVWTGGTPTGAVIKSQYRYVAKNRIAIEYQMYTGTALNGATDVTLSLPVAARNGGSNDVAYALAGVRAGSGVDCRGIIANAGSVTTFFGAVGLTVDSYFVLAGQYDI